MSFLIGQLYPVFSWVISVSIKVSILIVLILFIRALLRGKMVPRLNQILWLIVMLRIIMPDIYKSDLTIYKLAPGINQSTSIIDSISNDLAVKTKEQKYLLPTNNSTTDSSKLDSNDTSTSKKANDFRHIPFIAWLIGLIAIVGTTLAININFLVKLSNGKKIRDTSITNLLDKCREEMGISRNVMLIETNRVKVFGLLGFISPKILIPENLIKKLSEDDLRYVFLHELSHLKRGDILVNWASRILTAFHWFNPIVWYGFNKMREDTELCCDSLVMSRLNTSETIDYGHTIIKLAENISMRTPMLITASITSNNSQTKRRIKMIRAFKRYPYKLSVTAILIIALFGVIAFVGAKRNVEGNNSVNDFNEHMIVYTTHPKELYKNGLSALETGKKLEGSLKEAGVNSRFLEIPKDTTIDGAFETSRNLLQSQVKDYGDKILLDIHVNYGIYSMDNDVSAMAKNQEGIKKMIGKKNTNFQENSKFAELLVSELKNNNIRDASIVEVSLGRYNQDLSAKSILVELGTANESKEAVDFYINALTQSLKKLSLQQN